MKHTSRIHHKKHYKGGDDIQSTPTPTPTSSTMDTIKQKTSGLFDTIKEYASNIKTKATEYMNKTTTGGRGTKKLRKPTKGTNTKGALKPLLHRKKTHRKRSYRKRK
jgi:hypothetical protein